MSGANFILALPTLFTQLSEIVSVNKMSSQAVCLCVCLCVNQGGTNDTATVDICTDVMMNGDNRPHC